MTVAPLHVVVPGGIDDPARPSGGNRYDRRLIDALGGLGHVVREHRTGDLAQILDGLPDDTVVLVDGLLACFAPATVVAATGRLRVAVLLHMPFAEADESVRRDEQAVLAAAAGVVTTSDWARGWVVRHHGLPPERVWTAPPGVDPAPVTTPSATGGRLLCLGAVTRDKGHDVLLSALAELADLEWQCTCTGTLDLEPDYVAGLHEIALRSGIADRVLFTGPLDSADVVAALAQTDLLVSASRHESYGMAVTEALAHAVPVVVTDVGGHAEAVGAADGRPGGGVLVPADDPDQLATALRRWLGDADERARLRAAAELRRSSLGTWADTARRVADALDAVALNRTAGPAVSPETTHPTSTSR